MKKVLVTGSRDWTDENVIEYALEVSYTDLVGYGEGVVLLSGNCPTGADRISEQIWEAQGLPVLRFPANWNEHGRSAGPIRNKQMIDESPDIVLAFPKGSSYGTRGTIKMAEDAGLNVQIFTDELTGP